MVPPGQRDAERRASGRIPDGARRRGGLLMVEGSDSESEPEAELERTAAAGSGASAAMEEGAQKEDDEWKGNLVASEQEAVAGWSSSRMEKAQKGGEGACGTVE